MDARHRFALLFVVLCLKPLRQVINDRAQVRLFVGRPGLFITDCVMVIRRSMSAIRENLFFCFWREMAMTGGMSFDYIGSPTHTEEKRGTPTSFESVCTQVDRMRSTSCAFAARRLLQHFFFSLI